MLEHLRCEGIHHEDSQGKHSRQRWEKPKGSETEHARIIGGDPGKRQVAENSKK